MASLDREERYLVSGLKPVNMFRPENHGLDPDFRLTRFTKVQFIYSSHSFLRLPYLFILSSFLLHHVVEGMR